MKIHPIWYICLLTRFSIFLGILYISSIKNSIKLLDITVFICLLLIGIGFLYKSLTGSNNETQIAKVFWHQSRIFHSVIFLIASIMYIYNFKKIAAVLILLDIIFSLLYRIIIDK